jgi:hypothetical protein
MRATPCLNVACLFLNLREDSAPVPAVCGRCGGTDLLRPPTPTPLAALRESVRRRVLAVDGDDQCPL